MKETTGSNLYLSGIGVGIMLVFVCVSLMTSPCTTRSRWGCGSAPLGLAGIALVVADTVASLGFTCYLGVPFNATSLQVLPFLALGLGVDDLFLILHCYEATVRDLDEFAADRTGAVARVIGNTMSRAGPSVTMTTAANFAAFLIGATIPLPAVSSFCLQAAAIEVFNYVFLMVGMTVVLVGWEHVTMARQLRALTATADDTVATGAADPGRDDDGMVQLPGEGSAAALPGDDGGGGGGGGLGLGGGLGEEPRPLERCIDRYADCLLRPAVKAGVIVGFAAFLGVSAFFATTVQDGLDISDIAPKGSALSRFLADKVNYFSSFDAKAYTTAMDYPCRQTELAAFLDDLRANPWVSYVRTPWIESYQHFLRNHSRATVDGRAPPAEFYAGIHDWENDLGSSLDVLSSGMDSFGWETSAAGERVELAGGTLEVAKGELVLAAVDFTVDGLTDTQAYADMIRSVRALCTKAADVSVCVRAIPDSFRT